MIYLATTLVVAIIYAVVAYLFFGATAAEIVGIVVFVVFLLAISLAAISDDKEEVEHGSD